MAERCSDPSCEQHWPAQEHESLARESRLEGVVMRLREQHADCPEGIPEFQCNLRRIDEVEIGLIIDEWERSR